MMKRLTIDEAIELYKMKARAAKNFNIRPTVSYTAEECEQHAEWLEELKAYREIGTVEECKGCVLEILEAYNKAIDDFVKELKNHYTEYNIDCVLEDVNFYSYTTACNYLEDYIDEIAEHLKAGVKNERM